MNTHNCIANDVRLGKDVKLSKFINLYGCSMGNGTKIGAFVEIQKNAAVAEQRSRVVEAVRSFRWSAASGKLEAAEASLAVKVR
jgi:hypothetical protein